MADTPSNTTPAIVFTCGPVRCDHDYSNWIEYKLPSGAWVGTGVCAKCGAEEFQEAAWN